MVFHGNIEVRLKERRGLRQVCHPQLKTWSSCIFGIGTYTELILRDEAKLAHGVNEQIVFTICLLVC